MANEGPQLDGEIWKDTGIEFLDGKYQVSSYGRVKRKIRRTDGDNRGYRWLLVSPYDHHAGPRINARRYSQRRTYKVANLVADAFGLEPKGTRVYHKDKYLYNCNLENLRRARPRLTKEQKTHILETLQARRCQYGTIVRLAREIGVPWYTVYWYRVRYFNRYGKRKRTWEGRLYER